jgi:hypothetical protein
VNPKAIVGILLHSSMATADQEAGQVMFAIEILVL